MRTARIPNTLNLRNYLKDTRPGVWHSVSIPLKDFGLNAVNDTNIKKLAAVALRPGTADGNEYTIYLDDIELLPASLPSVSALNAPVLQEAKAYERHIDIKWIPQSKEGYKITIAFTVLSTGSLTSRSLSAALG